MFEYYIREQLEKDIKAKLRQAMDASLLFGICLGLLIAALAFVIALHFDLIKLAF